MLLLTSTSDLLRVTTSAASAIDVHCSWSDLSGTPQVAAPGRTNTAQITTATTTTIVASPAASTQRNVKLVTIRNAHATVSCDVTVAHTDGTTVIPQVKLTLLPGDALHFNDMTGWSSIPANNSVVVPGRLLLTTVKTTGTTFTTGPLTNKIFVRMVAGGAGGAGCTSVASGASAGGGGGAGGYAEKTFDVTPNTAYTCQVGALGAGVSGAAGANATDSTFAVGATTVTAKGGTGAPVATAVPILSGYAGGAGGTVSTNGDVNSTGEGGRVGMTLVVSPPVVCSGNGGSSRFGSGGLGIVAVGNGNAGTGFGAGGGGAATGASTVRTGGSGTAGVIIVEEFS